MTVRRNESASSDGVPHSNGVASTLAGPIRFVTHSRKVLDIAQSLGWHAGARYTNLRDVKHLAQVNFLDIDWRTYDFNKHLHAAKETRPNLTVARDVIRARDLRSILREAEALLQYADEVIIVPKAPTLARRMRSIPSRFLLGYSVPSRYGGTRISPEHFNRKVHLLGGRPDLQRRLGERMHVASLDCNRFTFDAAFGDFFDGQRFRPHPIGGYEQCLRDSLEAINRLWDGYNPPERLPS